MASHEVKTKADLLRLIDRAADEGWTELDLAGLGLEELPREIGKLERLETLILGKHNKRDSWQANIHPVSSKYSAWPIGNYLRELPKELLLLENLKVLRLSGNPFLKLDKIFDIVSLEELELVQIELEEIPNEITQLENLRILNASFNRFSFLPDVIVQLQCLQNLDLASNQIREITREIAKLENLHIVELGNNNIEDISEEVLNIQRLQILDLGMNEICQIPDSIKNLHELQILNISHNKISQIPEAVFHLRNLHILNLEYNQINHIPQRISQLENLHALCLGDNRISDIPKEISHLKNIQFLNLGNNNISKITEGITQLPPLKTLLLWQNKISNIPEIIAQLCNLNTLNLNRNCISEIPGAISHLEELQGLFLGGNKITEIPKTIENLQSLETLALWQNEISEIPAVIANLQSLETLDLRSNQISSLPQWTKDCTTNFKLALQGNQISVPIELLTQPDQYGLGLLFKEPSDLKTLTNFYFKATAEDAAPLSEAKLLIVGEGSVGKTTLAKKLQYPFYELNPEDSKNPEKSTEGIEVNRISFDQPNGDLFKINIWDFGGQEIYHATHQFFLTRRSLYALVIDSRRDLNLSSVYYWLNIIRLLGDNSPVLLIKNEKSKRQCEIDEGSLRKEFPNLINQSISVDLADNTGLDQLRDHIQQRMTQLDGVNDPWPHKWAKVRYALENYSKNPKAQYIEVANYLALCHREGITDKNEALTISSQLHELGICLHFQSDLGLKNYVILSPTWATNAVYKVTDSQKIKDDLGRFSREDLDEIWSGSEYADVQDELLALMQKFAICYPLRGEREGSFIAPSLLSIDRPDYHWEETNNLILRYTYEFMPKGLITRLIVEMHELIEPDDNVQGLVWKSGVVLRHGNARAEVIENYNKSELSIRVAGAQQKTLLDWIRREIYKIHRSYPNIQVEELIPCNCSKCKGQQTPVLYPLSILQQFETDKQYEIQCSKSYQMVNVRRLISDVTEPLNPDFPNSSNRQDIMTSKFTQNNSGNAKGYQADVSGGVVYQAENIYITNNPEPKTPAEAAEEIKDLLIQLAKDNPLATEDEKAEHVRKALPPSRLQRITEIVQTAGEAAVETIPGGKIVTAVLKKVREQEADIRKAEDS